MLITGLISISMGCTAPESVKNADKEHIVGGVAVGVSPKVIYAEKGENVSFNVDLLSTENADDRVTISISGMWINKTLTQNIKAGGNTSIPVIINVPVDALNMTYKIKVLSSNLNSTSSSTGVILIKDKRWHSSIFQ